MAFTFTAPTKDPQATLIHSHDLTAWLQDGETITAQAVTAQSGLTISGVTEAGGVVTYTVEGGTAGVDYIVTCQVTTSDGRIDERSVRYKVRER